MDTLKNFLENLANGTNEFTIFLSLTIVLSTFFFLCLFLSIFIRNYGKAKRAWFLFIVGGVYFLQKALTIKSSNGQTLSYITLSLGALFYAIIFAVRVRAKKPTKEQKELARFIDKHLCKSDRERHPFNFRDVRVCNNYSSNPIDEKEEFSLKQNDEYGVDFEHVKSVIDKLEYYGLSQSDKKQVQELEYSLKEAKEHGFSPLVKSKINDGLGALLKIMSKYGV